MKCVDVKRGALIVFEGSDRTGKYTQFQKLVDKLRDMGDRIDEIPRPKMKQLLQKGVTLAVDRYSYSGVAYSPAKAGMDFEWCCKPEIGLMKPDLALLLNVPAKVRSERSGFGKECYENDKFLDKVYENFLKLKNNWMLVDGSRSIKEIHEEHTKACSRGKELRARN